MARGCPPSCPPAWRACGRLTQEVGGPRLSPQLCPQLSPLWRECGRLAQEVGGSRLSPSFPPAVPLRGEPMDSWPRSSVARELSPQLSPQLSFCSVLQDKVMRNNVRDSQGPSNSSCREYYTVAEDP